jgi:hypothetical protein
VSSTDNRICVDKRATAEVGARELDANDEREIALSSGYATNNVRGVLVPVRDGLGQSCTRDEGRHRKGDEDGFGKHVGEVLERESGRSLS